MKTVSGQKTRVSGRSILAAALLGSGALVAGCQSNAAFVKEPTDPAVIVDQAMLHRDWPQAKAQWSNAQLVAWPTRFPFDVDVTQDRPFPNSRTIDTLLFLVQTAALPFTYFYQAPFQQTLYTSGVRYDPTYTAMPPLPPPTNSGSNGPTPVNSDQVTPGTPNSTGDNNTAGSVPNPNAPGGVNAPGAITPGGVTPAVGAPNSNTGAPGSPGSPGGASGPGGTGGAGSGGPSIGAHGPGQTPGGTSTGGNGTGGAGGGRGTGGTGAGGTGTGGTGGTGAGGGAGGGR